MNPAFAALVMMRCFILNKMFLRRGEWCSPLIQSITFMFALCRGVLQYTPTVITNGFLQQFIFVYKQNKICWVFLFLFLHTVFAQDWQTSTDGFFVVEVASLADSQHLKQVFDILQQAKKDLIRQELKLPDAVTVQIHPDINSYVTSVNLPWYIAAVANRETNTIQTQRLEILIARNSLEKTLRHELFHLAQPEGWLRWKAEGKAMLFAGELPQAEALVGISEARLEDLLANPPSREMLQQAVATAYTWVIENR